MAQMILDLERSYLCAIIRSKVFQEQLSFRDPLPLLESPSYNESSKFAQAFYNRRT